MLTTSVYSGFHLQYTSFTVVIQQDDGSNFTATNWHYRVVFHETVLTNRKTHGTIMQCNKCSKQLSTKDRNIFASHTTDSQVIRRVWNIHMPGHNADIMHNLRYSWLLPLHGTISPQSCIHQLGVNSEYKYEEFHNSMQDDLLAVHVRISSAVLLHYMHNGDRNTADCRMALLGWQFTKNKC